MKQSGVFDIVGPVMIGPSSSHTAGAARLGLLAGLLCGEKVRQVRFLMHGSFARTYRGHGTDKALVAGILGISYDDSRLKESFSIAGQQGLFFEFVPEDLGEVHPNTVRIVMTGESGRVFTVTGSSVGGGSVCLTEIDGVRVFFQGEAPVLVTVHRDEPGVIASITGILYRRRINIGNMQVSRRDSGEASMYLELWGELEPGLKEELGAVAGVRRLLLLETERGGMVQDV